jgi:PBSX family phage portal protein
MGNGYLEMVPNLAGRLAAARHTPARHTRRGRDDDVFWFVNGPIGAADHRFEPGRVFQLQQPDVAQEIYGLPEWLSALQSGLLNENATLFRRRYYLNGAHAGFILYVSEALADQDMADGIEQAMRSAKGIGNFKNMFVYAPGGKKDGIQMLPIADVAAKDEFSSIKNISRDDLLAAHRVPPQLIGIIPQNNGGFGKVDEALDAFYAIEIVPIIKRMRRMNQWFGVELLRFRPYTCSNGDTIDQDGVRLPAGATRG